jgi:hypothetical protein
MQANHTSLIITKIHCSFSPRWLERPTGAQATSSQSTLFRQGKWERKHQQPMRLILLIEHIFEVLREQPSLFNFI